MTALHVKQTTQEHKKVYLSRNLVLSRRNFLFKTPRFEDALHLNTPRLFAFPSGLHYSPLHSICMPRSLLKSSRLIDSYTVNSYRRYTRHKREKERRTVSYFINGFDLAYKKF
jgi:hypothetical protein